jgi:TRAP-type C4-dicarboxylate transport system permease small subunit
LSARPVSWLERADRWGRFAENAALIVLLGGLIALASVQILLRNAFSLGFSWGDGLVRLGVLWIAVLGAIAASRDGRHIAIDVLAKILPPRARTIVAVIRHLFTACVCAVLTWHAARFVESSREFGDVLLGNWPAWWFEAILPVGFALMAYRYSLRAARALMRGE